MKRIPVFPRSPFPESVGHLVSPKSFIVLVKQVRRIVKLLVSLLPYFSIVSVEDRFLHFLLVRIRLVLSRETLRLLSPTWIVIISQLELRFLLLSKIES